MNRPELNALRFINRPSTVSKEFGDRLYKTGDWGYLKSDGSLEICGRCDTMVKIRGYTVELQVPTLQILIIDRLITIFINNYIKGIVIAS